MLCTGSCISLAVLFFFSGHSPANDTTEQMMNIRSILSDFTATSSNSPMSSAHENFQASHSVTKPQIQKDSNAPQKRVRSALIRQQGMCERHESESEKYSYILLEYDAYSAVLSAVWAQGELNWAKDGVLIDLRRALHISE